MFNFNPSGAGSSLPSWGDSVGYNPSSGIFSSSSGGGGGGGMLAAAGIGAVGQAIGGIASAIGAGRQADAMFAAAVAQAQAAERAGFQNLLGGQYALTGAKDYAQYLDRNAKQTQLNFFDPRQSQLGSEERARGFADALSPDAQKLRYQSNADQFSNTLAGKYSPLFGDVTDRPFRFGQMPGYATGKVV
jgi:hypothetical protein